MSDSPKVVDNYDPTKDPDIKKLGTVANIFSKIPYLKSLIGVLLYAVLLFMYLSERQDNDNLKTKVAIYESGAFLGKDTIAQRSLDARVVLINKLLESKERLDSLIAKHQVSTKDTISLEDAIKIINGLK